MLAGGTGAALNNASSIDIAQGMVLGGLSAGISSKIPVPQNTLAATATRIGTGAVVGGSVGALTGSGFKEGATQGAIYSAVSTAYGSGAKAIRTRQFQDQVRKTAMYTAPDLLSGKLDAIVKAAQAEGISLNLSLTMIQSPAGAGRPFSRIYPLEQSDVNPMTLKWTRDLSVLDPAHVERAMYYGGDASIIVSSEGDVYNGFHRLRGAIEQGRPLNVQIGNNAE